jgi:hypothetical protein
LSATHAVRDRARIAPAKQCFNIKPYYTKRWSCAGAVPAHLQVGRIRRLAAAAVVPPPFKRNKANPIDVITISARL